MMTTMLRFSCLLLATCTSYLQTVRSDNPTSVVAPYSGPDPGYIIAECDGGLSNRLRVMAAYMYVAENKHNGAHLVFIWDVNEPCPGHFLQLFEPIPGVVFATNSSRYVLDKGAKIVFENSMSVFPWIMTMNGIPKSRWGYPPWTKIEYFMYSRYFPTREILNKVEAYVTAHNICNSSAMHVRATDMQAGLEKSRKQVGLSSYFSFVENRPVNESVYLLTDNPDTQKLFLDKYGSDKIKVYSVILTAEHQQPVVSAVARVLEPEGKRKSSVTPIIPLDLNRSLNGGKRKKGHKLTDDHRFTSLEHTLVDVLIAAHSKSFKSAPYSSLSELVNMFASVGKKDRGWCAAAE